ncbi:MAG: CsgG/HfaB family protein [Armatimonadota bacterium]
MRTPLTKILAVALLSATLTVAFARPGGPTIAVMPFDDAVIDRGFSWTHRARRWSPGAGVADLITGELVAEARNCGTFGVVERDRLFEVLDEQDLGASGRIDPATAARVGRIIGADLLLMGAVTRFDLRSDHVGLPRSIGFDAERHRATVGFEGRLVDTTTAEIIAQGRGQDSETRYGATIRRGELRGLDFGSSEFADSLLGHAARGAARALTRKIAVELDHPGAREAGRAHEGDALIVYAEMRDGQWWPMINRGARDGVREGDVLVVRRKRQSVFDPLTGELLKVIWDELGLLTIRTVEEKVASGPMVGAPDAPGGPREGDVAVLRHRH